MEIIVGKTAGFCYGVKRAVDGAKQELKKYNEIYCLGELIHNKQAIEELRKKGIKFINKIEDSKGTTIIRSHGEPKETYQKAERLGITLKDYTCPNVSKIHKIVEQYKNDGFYICLCGTPNHPENIGTINHAGENSTIIEKEDEIPEAIKKIKESKINKVILVSQTTYDNEKFLKIQQILKENLSQEIEFNVKNTICKATQNRQKETEKIAKEVDYMIIIGGKNSSNTKKLYEIANKKGKVIWIETSEELNIEELSKYNKIGIMAGASTPNTSIEDVVNLLKNVKY